MVSKSLSFAKFLCPSSGAFQHLLNLLCDAVVELDGCLTAKPHFLERPPEPSDDDFTGKKKDFTGSKLLQMVIVYRYKYQMRIEPLGKRWKKHEKQNENEYTRFRWCFHNQKGVI